MKQLTVLVDMDDTIENLCEVWVGFLNEKYDTSVSVSDITQWDMRKAFPTIPPEEITKPLFNEELWKRVTPLPGAVEYLKKIIEDGHRVLIVTASHPNTIGMKWNYVLSKHFPYLAVSDLIITSQKQLIKGDILVDDAIHNLIGGDYVKLLYDTPHNRDFDTEQSNVIRVHGWEEIYSVINDIAGRSL